VSTTTILLKAKRLAEENKTENCRAYPSWAFRLMRRNNKKSMQYFNTRNRR
jgi:hypothetical protein